MVVNDGDSAGYECRPRIVEIDLIYDDVDCRPTVSDGFRWAGGGDGDLLMVEYTRLSTVFHPDGGVNKGSLPSINMVFFAPKVAMGNDYVPLSLVEGMEYQPDALNEDEQSFEDEVAPV